MPHPAFGCRAIPTVCWRKLLRVSEVTLKRVLLALNLLWNGLRSLAIGDKRGWAWGSRNWIVVALSVFTLWIPALLFSAFCGYAGYQFLLDQTYAAEVQT